jgi:hypothetical protein
MTHAMLDDIEKALTIGDRNTVIWDRAKAAAKGLPAAIEAAVLAEREACAKLAETFLTTRSYDIASAIRSRKSGAGKGDQNGH